MQVVVSSGVFMKEGGFREPFAYHVSVQYICSRRGKMSFHLHRYLYELLVLFPVLYFSFTAENSLGMAA